MYNGIGLQTPRGSGTNGYVQRNLAFVKNKKERVDYKTDDDLQKLEQSLNKQPNREILDHERKRKVELKCMEMQELMEEQGYTETEVTAKVNMFRKMLMAKEGVSDTSVERDEHGRPVAKETHQLAEANQQKNERLKEAFGLSGYVEGSAFDPERKAKEEAARAAAMATKKYSIVQSSGEEEEDKTESSQPPKKKKKKSRHDSSSSVERSKEKHKKSRKHSRRDRSHSKKHRKSRRKSKRREKKRKKHRSYSSYSSSDSDDDDIPSRPDCQDGFPSTSKAGLLTLTTATTTIAGAPATDIASTTGLSQSVQPINFPATASTHDTPAKTSDSSSSMAPDTSMMVDATSLSQSLATGNICGSDALAENAHMKSTLAFANEKECSHRSKSISRSRSRSRSPTYHSGSRKKSSRRSSSYSSSSSASSRARSWTPSPRRRSHSSSRSPSNSRSHSSGSGRRGRRDSRSPSIRRRMGSPSHLDKRRITRSRSPYSSSSYRREYAKGRYSPHSSRHYRSRTRIYSESRSRSRSRGRGRRPR